MKNLNLFVLVTLSFTFLFTACTSPQRLLETGNYDQTIDLAIRKLAGKKKKDPVYVAALEEAFQKVTASNMRQIDLLKKSGNGNFWARILDLQQNIAIRQDKVIPLLPLIDKDGYQAEFAFVKIQGLIEESTKNAAEYHYLEGNAILEAGRKGDKMAARAAYEELAKTRIYLDNFKNTNALMHEAHDLGIVHILYQTKNRANTSLHPDFKRELEAVSVRDFNTFWKKYYSAPVNGISIDYRIVMNIEQINAGREIVQEREYVDYKEIEDGWDYVLDQNGNVLKDTLGNDIKIPRKVIIEAFVFESFQSKNAHVKGRLEYFDARTNELTYSDAINASAFFENYASTFRGDRRALSNDSRNRIGNTPRPFPSDNYLVLTAFKKMRPIIKDKMRNRDLTPRMAVIAGN